MALGGTTLGDVKQHAGHEPINILIQVPLAERSQITRLGDLPIHSQDGNILPLRELGEFQLVAEEDIIYHKDLRAVEYVTADVGGDLAAPVYGMFQVQDALKELNYVTPDGVKLGTDQGSINWFGPPVNDQSSAIEWTGEWTVTFETFRDMGAAFGVALIVIYILVVWEFGNFRIPALIMAPIPLTLLGIIPAHMLFFQMGWGGEFTATSMIGWIALAGIIVRNSILLVDFSIHEVQKGTHVTEAVILACKTRTRPIMITAFALVAGSSVIFFDPIFQGMAISLASGVLVSTILTLVVIPLGCIKASKSLIEVAAAGMPHGEKLPVMSGGSGNNGNHRDGGGPAGKPAVPLLLMIWSKLVGLVLLVFSAIRGIFLLLSSFFPKKKEADVEHSRINVADDPDDTPPDGNGGGASPAVPGGSAGPAGGTTAGNSSRQAAPAKKPAAKKTAAKKIIAKKAVTKKAVTKKAVTKKAVTKKAVTKKAVAKKAVAKKAVAKKAVVKKTVTKKEVTAKTPTQARPAVQSKSAGKPVANKPVPKSEKKATPEQAKKIQASVSLESNVIKPDKREGFGTAVRKKPSRRGIKLKSMNDFDGPSTLN